MRIVSATLRTAAAIGACVILGAAVAAEPDSAAVDGSTLNGKILCGYQAWFTAAGHEPNGRWIHWALDQKTPDGTNLAVEMYPDLREFGSDELFPTQMTVGGKPAFLYSAGVKPTVARHLRWMREYGIDGAFVQRFVRTHHDADAAYKKLLDEALWNVREAAAAEGRVFAVMYDISGMREEEDWLGCIQKDWRKLVDAGLTEGGRYVHERGRPVVGIWGFGFPDRVPSDPGKALEAIDWFKKEAPERYRAALFGGVPTFWRSGTGDSRRGKEWAAVYRAFDVVSPWTVGRFKDLPQFERFKKHQISADLDETRKAGIGYCPVIWPGFSWHNLKAKEATRPVKNEIPRKGGDHYWGLAHGALFAFQAKTADFRMIYVALFDEVDEGTAIYKVAATAADAPDQGSWLTLDADGRQLPSDWYLRLTYEIGRMLRGETPLTAVRPDAPGPR